MNNRWYIILFVLLLTGCEVIREDDRLIPVNPGDVGAKRHLLLEFTGFRCVNCPDAAELAAKLKQTYGEQLYIVSLHPASNPFTQGKYDYTCPAADSIYQWMGGTPGTPFPTGNIDLKPFGGSYFTDMNNWATIVHTAMQDTDLPDTLRAYTSYWLVEDSVLGVQAMPDGSVNDHYYHRHLLRSVANNGEEMVIPDGCRKDQLYLLTLYLDPDDNHLIQAYEEKLHFGSAMPASNY